jgi:hypothetical protein
LGQKYPRTTISDRGREIYLVEVTADFDKWRSHDILPLTSFSTYRFKRLRSGRWCFIDYFFNPTTRLEVTGTFPRNNFDHCEIFSTPRETSQKASRCSRWHVTKRPHFASEKKWTSCHNPRKKRWMSYYSDKTSYF